jgi:hypothetical protein
VILGVHAKREGFGEDGLWVWDLPWPEDEPGILHGGLPPAFPTAPAKSAAEGPEVAPNEPGGALCNESAENRGNDRRGNA